MSASLVDLANRNFAYGAIAASLFIFFVYHVIMYSSVFASCSSTPHQLSLNIRNTMRWVVKHKEKNDPASTTLAVQTLRNTILIAVFIGGNAFQLAFSFADNYQASIGNPIEQARSIILATLLFASFLSWATVIRFVAHLGYLIGTLGYTLPNPVPSAVPVAVVDNENGGTLQPTAAELQAIAEKQQELMKKKEEENERNNEIMKECIRILSLNMVFFSLGFRFLFVALPFAFLTMDGLGLSVATGVMMLFLFFFDYGYHFIRMPEVEVPPEILESLSKKH